MAQGIVEQPSSQAEQEKQQNKVPSANRSQLVQRLLDQTSSLPAFLHDLLTTQAVTVAGTEAAGFLIEPGGEKGPNLRAIAHIRPDNSTAETRQAALQAFMDIVKPCVQQGKDGAIEVGAPNDAHEAQFCLVTLLRSEGEVVAVSAVITRCINVERARQRLMSMQLVAGYFELFTLRRNSEQNKMIAQSHQHVLQLASSVATADGFESASQALCNELATRCHASRVSLGWLKNKNIKVKALSHTEQFDKKQELITQLEKAMEECLDQEEVVQYDPNPQGQSTNNVTRAHAALSRAQGGNAVLSLPLRRKDEIEGVITLEFPANQQLGPHVAQGVTVAVELLAPQLYDRFQNDRWLITKAAISTRELGKKIIGPKYMLAKVVVAAVLIAVLVLFDIPHAVTGISWLDTRMTYHVSAPFQFVPEGRRVVSAPYEGKLFSLAKVNGQDLRPGMDVKAGQVLAQMDTIDLKYKLQEALAKASAARSEERKFAGDRDPNKRGDMMVATHRREAAEAEAALYRHQIEEAEIKAPVSGVLLSGDLVHKIGDHFSPRDIMFEIGPVNDLKVEMSVSERDVQDLSIGQEGRIATSSLPSETRKVKVNRIVPMGEPKEGNNIFKVYAEVQDPKDPDWRPGMAGEARLDVRKEKIAWIWTHRLVDFVRLKLWLPF